MSTFRKRSEIQLTMSVAEPIQRAKIRRMNFTSQDAVDKGSSQDSTETEVIRNGVDRSPIPKASKRIRELEALAKGEPTKVEKVKKSVKVTKSLSLDQPIRRSARISRILNPLKILRSDSEKGTKAPLRKTASVKLVPTTSKVNNELTRASSVSKKLGVKVLPTKHSPKLTFSPILERSIETVSPLSSRRTAVTPVKHSKVTTKSRKQIPLLLLKPSFNFMESGIFTIELEKVEKKLGFTIVRLENPSVGFYVQTLTSEPAISDGRIQVGDKILSINGIKISSIKREDALLAFKASDLKVQLCLYRPAVEWIDGNNNEMLCYKKDISLM